MILDTFENAKFYKGIHPGIDKVLEEVIKITPENFPKEKVILDGDNVFMNPGEYETSPVEKASFEAHRLYIDVMCMIEGEETIYTKNTAQLKEITKEYNPQWEALLAKLDPDNTPVLLKAGSFCILFPQDAHAPNCWYGESKNVKKIVGKVRL